MTKLKEWENTIQCIDCLEGMAQLPDGCVDLVVTSPPYYMFKEYEQYKNYREYLEFLYAMTDECIRLIRPGRHIIINIDDAHHTISSDGNECFPSHALLTSHLWRDERIRFKDTVIWNKIRQAHQRGDGKSVLYGSYPYPNGIPIKNNCEFVIVAAKRGKPDYPIQEIKDQSKINWDFFREYCSSPWTIPAERNRIHPAPFPEEFARVCVSLFSFVGEIVLDCCAGGGTTAVAAKQLNRRFIGFEINQKYVDIANERLKQEVMNL